MPTNHEPRTSNIRLGISSYTYGWAVGVLGHEPPRPMDEHGLLDKAREHGVKLLQIGDNLPLHTFDDARIDRLAARARSDGVRLEVGARGLRVERVTAYAAIARRLGAPLIRFIIDDSGYHPSPSEVSAVLREVTPMLDGLTLGIENHDRFNAKTLRAIMESTGSDRVGICLDTSNSLGIGEGIEAVAAVLAPFTVNLHVKDFGIERLPYLMGFTVTGRPAGGGMLDLSALLSRLAPHGRCATAILELWTPPEPRIEDTINKEAAWATQSIAYLRQFLGSAR
ncbi:MAG: sugar phosphate isomerase/epimerase [Pedosphaera sp.]|nr:sugar phosphate isomerase/epimerase [Pedosphaera sp.]